MISILKMFKLREQFGSERQIRDYLQFVWEPPSIRRKSFSWKQGRKAGIIYKKKSVIPGFYLMQATT